MLKYLIAAVIAAAFAGSARAERDFEFPKTDNFDGGKVSALRIDMASGDISLVKSSGSDIKVDYKNIVRANDESEAKRLNDECKYSAEISGNKLVIKIEQQRHHRHEKGIISRIIEGDWGDEIHPMLRVSVPDNKSVTINSASADIEASEVNCDLRIESASSDISLENTEGEIECDISSGDIEVTGHKGHISLRGNSSDLQFIDVVGDVEGRTFSGDIKADNIKGNLHLITSSGDCRITDVNGELGVSSMSGDIVTDGATGSVRANAVSGDIRLSDLSAEQGDFDVKTVSGDIQMQLSSEFHGDIAIRTVSGTIVSKLNGKVTYVDNFKSSSHSQLHGTAGDGGAGRLNVASTSGDIDINGY